MEPIKRFRNSFQEGNLWIYILSLAKEIEIKEKDVVGLIFEKFGFLPHSLMVKAVLFRLKNDGYVSRERFVGEKAYKITSKGTEELSKMRSIVSETMEKLC